MTRYIVEFVEEGLGDKINEDWRYVGIFETELKANQVAGFLEDRGNQVMVFKLEYWPTIFNEFKEIPRAE